ncbi:hypothetical protein [Corallococcus terminator]|uniref:Glycosyltransferase n=1 Tax=Corallococcus terminator TaxID=2316733 RepID=A0A3A8JCW4_9BACT|nr:hypothetical protein [Corallococcus terminator]RKG93255.1 hypothetical protein D7V88_03175 [Corallococcus terminator]
MRIRGEPLNLIVRQVLLTTAGTDSDQDICFRVFNHIRGQGNTVQFPDIIVALDDARGNRSETALAHRRVTRLAETSRQLHAEQQAAETAPRLHYIWWGPVPQSGLEGITAMATHVGKAVAIHFWCKAEHATAFAEALPQIKVCGLDAGMNHALLPHNGFELLAPVVEWLTSKRAFSAVKDVLMLYLLYQIGGHYLDTTTAPMSEMVRSKYKGVRFDTASVVTPMHEFTSATLGIKFAGIGMGRDFYVGSNPWSSDTVPSRKVLMTPSVDFWAAWAKQGNAIARASLEAYLEYATELKLKAPDKLDTNKRDAVIGDLITLSVQKGMLKEVLEGRKQGQEVYDLLLAEIWPVSALDKRDFETLKANFTLPQLGVMKWHKGTWRNNPK